MSQNGQNFRKPRKKTALDHAKMRLYGEKQDGAKSAPTFLFYITEDGNPRIDVYTGVEGDKDNGLIRAAMDVRTAAALMELAEEVINHNGACRYHISNMNYLWPGGKRSDKPVEISKTVMGKSEDGRIYITVIAKDRPKVVFYLTSTFFHKITDAEGQAVPVEFESRLFARGYFKKVANLLDTIGVITYKQPEPKQGGQGGWSNNNNNNNNNSGGGWNNNSGGGDGGFDKDVPF